MIIARWIATTLSLTGAVLNARKMIFGYWVWIVANVMWFSISIIRKDYAQAVLWAVYAFISAYGIYCWMKEEK